MNPRSALNFRAALKPSALGYLAALALYFFLYHRILALTFGDSAPLFMLVMGATVILWHAATPDRGNRVLYFWATCAPLLGASLGYLVTSLLFLVQHGQFIGGFGLDQWLFNVTIMATFMARAWLLSFLLTAWATVLYVMKPVKGKDAGE